MEDFHLKEQDDKDLESRARKVLSDALRLSAFSCLGGGRLPALDTKGMMADAQIREPQLEAIRNLVEENWPNVTSIEIRGSYGNNPHLECSIHFHPFSKEGQRDHWPLGDQIRAIVDDDNLTCFFLPNFEPSKYGNQVEILRKDPPSEDK